MRGARPHRAGVAAALAAALLLLASCGDDGPAVAHGGSGGGNGGGASAPSAAPVSLALSDEGRASLARGGVPQPGGTLVQSITVEYGTLNNILRTTNSEETLCRLFLFPPLLDIDPDTLELVPLVAAELPTLAADSRTYTWNLKPGIRWHRGDGSGPVEVTTADVVYAWRMISDPTVRAERVRASLGPIESVRALDRYTFEVVAKRPYYRVELEFGYNFRLMPAHLGAAEPAAFNDDPLGRDPVGYGPYRFAAWKSGEYVELEKNRDWFAADALPYWFDRYRVRFIADTAQTPLLFERGELSICPVNDCTRWEEMKREAKLAPLATFHEYYLAQWLYIVWNQAHPAFADARVRRAMTLLYPRELVKEKVYLGHAAVISTLGSVAAPEYDASVAPLPFDPAAARALLDEAGWIDRDGDGWRDRDGARFRFTLKHPRTPVPAIAVGNTWFQQQLKEAGVEVELLPVDSRQLFKELGDRAFDAGQLSWVGDPRDDDLYDRFHSSAVAEGANYGGLADPETDRLLELHRGAFVREERLALAHALHRRIAELQPVTPLYNPQSLVLVSTKLRNVKMRRLGARWFDWWQAP
ncbi:MAG: hypothetical protein JNL90_08660 [Planctomycetes bacterium]|nr:hypothetical protein [Planctomycetota bacterium]